MTLIAEVFPKLRTPKNMVTSMSKKSRFKGSFGKQHGKRAQTLLKFAWQHLYHIYWSLWMQLTCKKSLLVTWKILWLFPNTLSADGKYYLLNRDDLTQPIQMLLSRKQKTFSQFFAKFLKSSLILEHFLKKDDRQSRCISEITDPEKLRSGSVISAIILQWGSPFCKKCSKFRVDFKNIEKKLEKDFSFRDNCIWIGCIKLSLLRREYLPSALSMLGNSLEFLHVTNREFWQVICLPSDQ